MANKHAVMYYNNVMIDQSGRPYMKKQTQKSIHTELRTSAYAHLPIKHTWWSWIVSWWGGGVKKCGSSFAARCNSNFYQIYE